MKTKAKGKRGNWDELVQTDTAGKVAAVYCRVSRDDAATPDAQRQSIDTQKRLALELAAKNGWATTVYSDSNLSGFSDEINRPAFARMIADIEAKKIHHVIVQEKKRLARDGTVGNRLIDEVLIPNGVGVEGTIEKIDIGTPEGRFMFDMEMAMSRKTIGEGRKKAMLSKADMANEGKLIYKPCLGFQIGMRNGTKVMEPNNAELETVKFILEKVAERMPLNTIGRILSEKGIRGKSGAHLGAKQIVLIAKQPCYIGKQFVEGKIIDSKVYPAVIDVELWQKAQDVLNGRNFKRGRISNHLLTGILKCGYCSEMEKEGKRVFPTYIIHGNTPINSKIRYEYYTCLTQDRLGKKSDCHGNLRLPKVDTEKAFENFAINWLANHYEDLPKINGVKEKQARLAEIEKQIASLDNRVVELEQDYALKVIPDAKTWNRLTNIVTDKLTALKEQRGALIEDIRATDITDATAACKELAQWGKMDVIQRRNLLKRLIEAAYVYKHGVEIQLRHVAFPIEVMTCEGEPPTGWKKTASGVMYSTDSRLFPTIGKNKIPFTFHMPKDFKFSWEAKPKA